MKVLFFSLNLMFFSLNLNIIMKNNVFTIVTLLLQKQNFYYPLNKERAFTVAQLPPQHF